MELNKIITETVFKLYLYADWTKAIHYSTESNHIHELCDTVRDDIIDFADELAEMYYGDTEKPTTSDITLSMQIKESDDIRDVCQSVIDMVTYIRKQMPDTAKGWYVQSLIDDFVGKMNKDKFLGTLDRIK